jgi:hypothetical protein
VAAQPHVERLAGWRKGCAIMIQADDLRRVSWLARTIVSAMLEAHDDAELYQATGEPQYSTDFVEQLRAIEEAHNAYPHAGGQETEERFIAVNSKPAKNLGSLGLPSVHAEIFHHALSVGAVASAVMHAIHGPPRKTGIYRTPPLPDDEKILRHIDVAIKAFQENFPSPDQLSQVHAPWSKNRPGQFGILGPSNWFPQTLRYHRPQSGSPIDVIAALRRRRNGIRNG